MKNKKNPSKTPLQQGLELKEDGIQRATDANTPLVRIAQRIAIEIALQGDGTCDSDQVRAQMIKEGYYEAPKPKKKFRDQVELPLDDQPKRPNPAFKTTPQKTNSWMGGVFKIKGQWEKIGTVINTHSCTHARPITKWRYIGG
jgi:hypothetical protein